MLIIMKKFCPEENLDQIKEYLITRDFDIHQSTGANRTIIGVIGNTDTLDDHEIETMLGVSQVVRIKRTIETSPRTVFLMINCTYIVHWHNY